MMTFKYQRDGNTLYIRDYHGEMRIITMDEHHSVGVTLDQVGLDALRNYLDDLGAERE
jgi:hypothetical protein